jgi:hypothetical protein
MREREASREGSRVFILTDRVGLWCTGDGRHWVPWAAVRGGTVS